MLDQGPLEALAQPNVVYRLTARRTAECAGSQFDPAVVRAFLVAWAEGAVSRIRAA